MPMYRKKPVVVEAIQLPTDEADLSEEHLEALHALLGDTEWTSEREGHMHIYTLEGVMDASPGDWIIKGVKGECYPCKPDIFAATYEPATPAPASVEGCWACQYEAEVGTTPLSKPHTCQKAKGAKP